MPQSTNKLSGASCPASCVQGFKAKAWGGRGAGTPAPQLRLAPAKFGAGKFCRFAQRKTKNQEMLKEQNILLYEKLLTQSKAGLNILFFLYALWRQSFLYQTHSCRNRFTGFEP